MDIRKGKRLHHPFHYLTQIFKVLMIGSIILFLVFTISHFRLSQYFPIKKVRVYGLNHIGQQDVQELLMPLVRHGFFKVNVEYIRDRLLQQPWVSDIFVRRNWPDQIEVIIVERRAIALWGGEVLLSEGGILFSPKIETYPLNLPIFMGPEGKQIIMLNYFYQINRILSPLHVKISYLELTPYMIWKLKLNNGISMQIGHKDILTRLTHFVKVYPKIVGNRGFDVDSIDLRYPNGVAVRWKTPIKT